MRTTTHQTPDRDATATAAQQPTPAAASGTPSALQSDTLPMQPVDATTTCDDAESACAQSVLKKSKTSGQTSVHRGGAPHQNTNNRQHGMRGTFTIAKAVPGEGWARALVNKLRRRLLEELGQFGKPSTTHQEALANTACRCELAIKLLERWAAKAGRTEEQRLEAAEKLVGFAERRDKAIERLLGKAAAGGKGDDIWAMLSTSGGQHGSESPTLPSTLLEEIDGAGSEGGQQ